MEQQLEQLAAWLKQSTYTVVLTGAGMSTESGIPDFRSPSGWWKNIDPLTVATVDALEEQYPLFQEFYSTRMRALADCRPHRGHEILAEWEQRGLVHHVATQNVDGFHQQAGSRSVSELHGSIHTMRCANCDATATQEDFLDGRSCARCGGKLRPNVVLFGEMLPEQAWGTALTAIRKSELVLVIGTSLQVYPVNQLPSMTQGHVAILNYEPTELDHHFDLVLHGKAGEVLQELDQRSNPP